jgi:osmotically inducible protein OsmC
MKQFFFCVQLVNGESEMPNQAAHATWEGDLKSGKGTMVLESLGRRLPFGFTTRFEDDESGTNPEELIGAAHAGCFSMALTHLLAEAGHSSKSVVTAASVELKSENGEFSIPAISLETEADVPGIEPDEFQKIAETAKQNCPVSKLLNAEITMRATLKS